MFGQLLHRLLCIGWLKGSEIDTAKAESQWFVREQRQVEQSGSMHVPMKNVFSL